MLLFCSIFHPAPSNQRMRIKLSGILRLFISAPNNNIVTGVALNKKVSVAQMETALELVAQQQAFLKMVPVIDAQNDAYLESKPDLKIVVKEYQQKAYDALAHQELQTVHQLNKRALVHFVLNQHPTHTDLIVVINHAICDGVSLNHLLQHLLIALNGNVLPAIPAYRSIEELAPTPSDSWSKNLFIKLVNKVWQNKQLILNQSMIDQSYKNYWRNRHTKLLIEDLSPALTTAILQHCKKATYSVNTFLCAVFLYARHQVDVAKRPTINNFIVTANLRAKLLENPGEGLGCYVNTIKLDLPKDYQPSVPQYAQELQQTISNWFNSSEPLNLLDLADIKASVMDAANLNKYGIRSDWLIQKLIRHFDMTKVNTELILTNYGKIDIPASGDYQIQDYWPIAISSAMTIEKYISVYTYHGKMRLGICYDGHVISEKDIATYIKTFKTLLTEQLATKEAKAHN